MLGKLFSRMVLILLLFCAYIALGEAIGFWFSSFVAIAAVLVSIKHNERHPGLWSRTCDSIYQLIVK